MGPEHPNTLVSIHNVGAFHYERGDYAKALPLLGHFRLSATIVYCYGLEHKNTKAAK